MVFDDIDPDVSYLMLVLLAFAESSAFGIQVDHVAMQKNALDGGW